MANTLDLGLTTFYTRPSFSSIFSISRQRTLFGAALLAIIALSLRRCYNPQELEEGLRLIVTAIARDFFRQARPSASFKYT